MKTVFLRVLEAEDKATALLAALREPDLARGGQRFEVDPKNFESVPRSPFAYWVSERLRRLFKELPPFEAVGRTAFGGMKTQADARFLRAWWEPSNRPGWVLLCKGGKFAQFYSDPHLLTEWSNGGAEPRAAYEAKSAGESWGGFGRNEAYYFRPGLTWPRRTQRLGVRVLPGGCIFGDKGPAAFVDGNTPESLLATLAIQCSSTFDALVALSLNAADATARSFEVGIIQRTPFPALGSADEYILATLARRAWSLKRSLDTRTETSHAFTLPALLQIDGDTLAVRANVWGKQIGALEAEVAAIQAEIDARCFDLYGIDEADRYLITEGFGGGPEASDANTDAETDDDGHAENSADATSLAVELVSWAVGVAFGRFDVRLATGARALPPEPEPFDSLPVCSPAMLTGDDGLPLVSAPAGYPIAFPENGILMDDPGHPRDLTAAARTVFEIVFGVSADAMWQEAAALLDPKDHDLRAWLTSKFLEHHLKRYSKSRRKAPILWQLAMSSGRYSVWLYAHRLTRDSFFQLQNDVVAPKLAHEERQLTSLVQSSGGSLAAQERKEIAAQESFVEELRAMLDEVKRVAPLWNPTLDDGVVLTMAPLWRLVLQHKPWQKELKSKWDELASGKYDWAYLAMHLWSERVIPKCGTDRSLAIAHGLENVFWIDDADGKWKPRPEPECPIEDLVRERSSPAVKAALKSLLEAPAFAVAGRRRSNLTAPRG